MPKFIYAVMFALVVSSLLLAACGQFSSSDQPNLTTTSQDNGQLSFGNYTTNLSYQDLNQTLPAYNQIVGKWNLKLEEKGDFSATLDDQSPIKGVYTVTGHQIAFSGGIWSAQCHINNSGDMYRRVSETPGIYNWEFDGSALTLKVASDDCAARSSVLSAHPWLLSPQS